MTPHVRRRRVGAGGGRRAALRAPVAVAVVLTLLGTLLSLWGGGASPAAAVAIATDDSPGSCNQVINGIQWNLDPCIPSGGPYPQDFADTLASLQNCPTPSASPSGTMSPTSATVAAAARRAAGGGGKALLTGASSTTATVPGSPPASPSPSTSTSPPTSPSSSASPTASPTGSPQPCPTYTSPSPDPSYTPPTSAPPSASTSSTVTPSGTALPSPSDTSSPTRTSSPSGSTSASSTASATGVGTTTASASPSGTPTGEQCGLPSATASALADPPGESADQIQCRDPKKIPDPGNPVTLVATGDSVTSAHNQTGFGIGRCDNTAADARGLTGNDANFSYAGKYYNLDKQIIAYYNFARTGFTTDDIRNGAAGKTFDACGNDWNRNDTPLNLATKVIKAAKAAKAAKSAAYYVTTGGVNNTNWTTVVAKLAECQGLGFAVNTLLAGTPGLTVNFYYIVPKVAPTDPPRGLYKNIISKGGACYATVQTGGWFPQTWWTRVGVPQYDGPGSPAPSPLSLKIGPDAAAIVNAVLGAGADKVVWMLYYDINPANIDVANLGLAAARAKMPAWAARFLPANVGQFLVSLIDPVLVPQVRALVTNLNNTIKNAIPANAKVAVQAAPALLGGDIQITGIGGSPHPNDNGHTKLANTLSTAFNGL